MQSPLAGVTVLDFTRLLPGAFCTLTLADLGAEVIKVEEPGSGDYARLMPPLAGGTSVYFLVLNRNKKSLTLDLKAPASRAIVDRLIDRADVLVDGSRPGVAERLGIGYARAHARKPRLVYCSITGFGQEGPYAGRAGHDLNYVALAGLLALDGRAGGTPPRLPRMFLADVGGGAMSAIAGILAGLVRAQRTGVGPHVDISMMEAALGWLAFPAARQLVGGASSVAQGTIGPVAQSPPLPVAQDSSLAPADVGPADLPLSGREACYNLYRTRDGRLMALGALEPKFWRVFCERIGRPDLIGGQFADDATQARMRGELAGLLATRTRAEWTEWFGGVDACCTPVNTVAEALADSHVRASGVVERSADPRAGQIDYIRSAIRMRGEAYPPISPAPALGEHTEEILAHLGFGTADITRFKMDGVT